MYSPDNIPVEVGINKDRDELDARNPDYLFSPRLEKLGGQTTELIAAERKDGASLKDPISEIHLHHHNK
ncbi:hypothetical protein XA3_03570 [Xylocopilactobacillus apicola]|uniref:Uncharacterized protein n=1 Tax=Xylocopilactobacillus apicola TaxID=2932184 RepID=A0AAU9DHX6_9LACO|nr:hypothetical protein XA3_03570 [Xylocopilactobacillus apicola]